ncbi:VOC family protein [Paractinoplanes atraurantiacus]|uniref:VOC family protein n=1 Tax=Paractinoplanes atraurantiacus TaxID=1036182 RepID=UPI001FE4B73B|nr:VOC family protein [Actinoplanes atraurantiacus]
MTGFLDSPSRVAEPFWQAVTGSGLSARRGPAGEFATLLPADGDAYLRVQVLAGAPPRTHADLHVESVAEAAAEAVGRGAVVVLDEGDLVVVRSPAGVVFCLVPWHGEKRRPGAGRRSLVDQLCVDVPSALFEAEIEFWSGLTGWPRRPSDLPEFEHLERGAGMPLKLLFQRIGSAEAGMHVDFACTDVDAEVRRHVELGASVVRRVPGQWTTLTDPVGREYCVTGRAPLPGNVGGA